MESPPCKGVESLRDLIEIYDREVAMLERQIHAQLRDHPGYKAIQAVPGVGKTIAAIMVAEIGDVTRFSSPEKLCSWAGLTPKHFESDTKVVRGRVTKQGSKLLRWAAIEAVSKKPGRHADPGRSPAHRRAPGQQECPHRCRPQAPHACLLWAA